MELLNWPKNKKASAIELNKRIFYFAFTNYSHKLLAAAQFYVKQECII
jgi:hypothetical protein